MLKKFFVGTGCGVWGVGCGVHPNGRHFLREKKFKNLIQQGFYIYSANPI
ncbi:hypothetical protein RVR34_26165 [Microcystis aeruginosa FBCC-A68]|nr:hypothetical protein [Microcystis aeruginosa]